MERNLDLAELQQWEFFEWLEATAARNAENNVSLADEEVLAIIERAREEVASAVE